MFMVELTRKTQDAVKQQLLLKKPRPTRGCSVAAADDDTITVSVTSKLTQTG
jgi:hypothetical protein